MSTELHLLCLDHDPPIVSDEVGVRLTDLPRIRADIANQ